VTAPDDPVFFVPLGDGRFASTVHTVGPWDERFQHGGPPAALLARAIEQESPSWPATVARMSVDILGPVPVTEVVVHSRVLRTGRSVELVEAEMLAGNRPVVRAQGWRVRAAELNLPDRPAQTCDVPAFPDEDWPLPAGWTGGYLHAMQWRLAEGHWGEPGAATLWARMRHPLVPGEAPSGLQRVMALADSGSGVSHVLPFDAWIFINPELTVHLAAQPVGDWIGMAAETSLDPAGFGLATSRLYDRAQLVGRGAQSLFVTPR
jgi:hypothetical protein